MNVLYAVISVVAVLVFDGRTGREFERVFNPFRRQEQLLLPICEGLSKCGFSGELEA